MDGTAFTLTEESAGGYLRRRGILPPESQAEARALSGGISNDVVRVSWPEGCVVLKQSLPRLRVEADWEFDQSRIFVERDCMILLERLVPGASPTVVFGDEQAYLIGMSCAPEGGVNWKASLMRGDVDPGTTRAAAALLGEIHRRTHLNRDVASQFDERMPLFQGRIDPYHRTAAAAHPDLAEIIDAEIERMLATRTVLVHGDYSPKNIIAYPGRAFVLDFEVAHWGDPAFDPAFTLTHLILKAAYHQGPTGRRLLEEAHVFWRSYRTAAGAAAADDASTARELGCLLLARIDGKSRIEYIVADDRREAVRRFARTILLEDRNGVGDVVDAAESLTRGGIP